MTKFTFAECFAGIGGFRAGLERLGGECVFASEWDKFAQQSYTALYGGEHLHGDITKVNEHDVPEHDILAFGMPCQAFSVAGKRLGFDDMRGTLYFEAMRIARAKKPKVLWMENVKGLVGHDKGRTLDVMFHAMNDAGYTVDFNVLNSKYFGVPQNRERIFMIGIRDDLVVPTPWHIEGNNVVAKGKRRISGYEGVKTFNFDFPTNDTVTTRLRDVLEAEVDEKYYLSDDKTAKLVAQLEERSNDEPTIFDVSQIGYEGKARMYHEVSPTITAREYKEPRAVGMVEGLPIREATTKGYAVASEGDAVNFQFPDSKTRRGRVGKQLANTLEASSINQGVVEPNMLGHIDLRGHDAIKRVYDTDAISPTLTTMGGGHREPKIAEGVMQRYRIRKLTPLECWRLQGFTDEQHQAVVDAGISDSQRYKQAGNAVTVNVIEAIGERLLPYLR